MKKDTYIFQMEVSGAVFRRPVCSPETGHRHDSAWLLRLMPLERDPAEKRQTRTLVAEFLLNLKSILRTDLPPYTKSLFLNL
jgi:hypothetical protein